MKRPREKIEVQEQIILDKSSTVNKIRSIPGLTSISNRTRTLDLLQLSDAFEAVKGIKSLISAKCFERWESRKLAVQVGDYVCRWDGSITLSEPSTTRQKQGESLHIDNSKCQILSEIAEKHIKTLIVGRKSGVESHSPLRLIRHPSYGLVITVHIEDDIHIIKERFFQYKAGGYFRGETIGTLDASILTDYDAAEKFWSQILNARKIGRAGRDGERSKCFLLWNGSDFHIHKGLIEAEQSDDNKQRQLIKKKMKRLETMVSFCKSHTKCRRKIILQYYGQPFDRRECKNSCDNCLRRRPDQVELDPAFEVESTGVVERGLYFEHVGASTGFVERVGMAENGDNRLPRLL